MLFASFIMLHRLYWSAQGNPSNPFRDFFAISVSVLNPISNYFRKPSYRGNFGAKNIFSWKRKETQLKQLHIIKKDQYY